MEKNKKQVNDFLTGKSTYTVDLFNHFVEIYKTIGLVELYATKTMIAVSDTHKRIAWVTQLGRNFIHIVFPFKKPHHDNLCFTKIAEVPGDTRQFNHHFRMLHKDDINDEVISFMKLAYNHAG